MIKPPKSMTATVHVRFHYADLEKNKVAEGHTEILARILDQSNDMAPELQEILVKFANYLNQQMPEE